jgi:ABC-type sugar transport system ATPase subunit
VATVTFEHVTKRFGETTAVADLSLEIEDGEFMVLVGPSGSGKTTALRLLAGLEALTSGSIRIGERVVDVVAPRERDIAMVFQDYALYPQMSVRQNLAFGLKIRKLQRAEIRRRVEETAELLGIEALLERKPRALSGGQRQRVALARALVHRPRLLLLDEPLGALDALTRIEMQRLIEAVWRELHFTAVLVTHDVAEAVALANRVLLVENGRIALDERVPLARPRRHGAPEFAALEERILERVLQPGIEAASGAIGTSVAPSDRRADEALETGWRWAV